MNTFSVGESIKYGWRTVKAHLGLAVGSTIIYLLLAGGSNFGDERGGKMEPAMGAFLLIAFVVSIIIQMGYTKLMMKLHDGEETGVMELFRHYRLFWKYVWTYVIMALLIVLPIAAIAAIGFGALRGSGPAVFALVLIVVVLGIFLSLRLSFALYTVLDRGTFGFAPIKESWNMTKGHFWKLFLFFLAIIGVNIVGLICLVVGLLVTIPLSTVAFVRVYRALSGPVAVEVPVDEPARGGTPEPKETIAA